MRNALFLILALAPLSATSDDLSSAPDFYGDRDRGWHWYEQQPEPPAKVPLPKPPPASPGGGGQGPAPLTTAWLRANLERFQMTAMDDPTPENVELYLLMQRLAADKSSRFAEVAERVVARTPYLDESTERPITAGQKETAAIEVSRERRAVLDKLAGQAGIWYFFRSDCPYCIRQNEALLMFSRLTGMPILPVSLDGLGMPDGAFPEFAVNSDQAEQLGITATPTLYIARPPDGLVRLSVGLRAKDEIESRVLMVARDEGWITDAEYIAATRGTRPTSLADGVLTVNGEPDPEALLQTLRGAALGSSTPWISLPQELSQ